MQIPQVQALAAALVIMWTAPAASEADRAGGGREPKSISELLADVPYAPVDALGVGYSEREAAAKTYAVTVNGGAATPLSRLVSIAFARAAALGLEHNWQTFKVTELKRSSDCETWSVANAPDAPISAGRPKLTITVEYEPDAKAREIRNSAETFKEMQERLDQSLATDQEKQATVDWVFAYCASTGSKDQATTP